jgi:hypothetical protein
MKEYIILLIIIFMLLLSYIILKITTLDYGIDYNLIKRLDEENK